LIRQGINGGTLKKLRLDKGLSQAELAIDCDLTKNFISELELGKRKKPSLLVAIKLANLFECKIEDLL
jgi:transcriptional regulator with XRE-family HTH domain